MSTNDNDPTDDDPITTTRRETMAAGATFPLAFWDDWSVFGEEETTEYDILRILNAESPVSDGITQLDFGDNLSVEQTAEDSVRIDAAAGSGSGATKLDDLDNVDVTGWLEGTFTNRPATGDVPVGTRYWATDRQTAYRNTSNGWDVNGGIGTASNPLSEQHVGSLSSGEAQSKDAPVVDVTHPDFGAVGDGSTDDTAAIDSAITYIRDNLQGGVLYFPAGTYLYSGEILLDAADVSYGYTPTITIEGAGSGASDQGSTEFNGLSTIEFTGSAAGIRVTSADDSKQWRGRITIKDLNLDGGNIGTSEHGIYFESRVNRGNAVENVSIRNFSGAGVKNGSGIGESNSRCFSNVFREVDCQYNTDGMIVGDNAIDIYSPLIKSNTNDGIVFSGETIQCNVYGGDIEVNENRQIRVYAATGVNIYGTYLEGQNETFTGNTGIPVIEVDSSGGAVNSITLDGVRARGNATDTDFVHFISGGNIFGFSATDVQVSNDLRYAFNSDNDSSLSLYRARVDGLSYPGGGSISDYSSTALRDQFDHFRERGGQVWQSQNTQFTNNVGFGAEAIDIDFRLLGRATAAPTSGSYTQGDVLLDKSPSAGGKIGWVCVADGSPGTWKEFGDIAA